MAHAGFATTEGTQGYAEAHSSVCHPGHYRRLNGLWLSSIGIGTYLGEADEATDAAYRDSVAAAVRGGCNVIDTAVNYRFQRSERSVRAALDDLFAAGEASRRRSSYPPRAGSSPSTPIRRAGRRISPVTCGKPISSRGFALLKTSSRTATA